MKQLLLLLVLLISSERLLSSANTDLFACLRRSRQVRPADVNLPLAQEAIVLEDEISTLVGQYVNSNTELQSLHRRRREFPCRESDTHDQTCACRSAGDKGFLTMEQLIEKAVFRYPGIMKFKVDLDEQGAESGSVSAREDDQFYGASKALPFILFRMDNICKRYIDVLEQEKKIIKQEKQNQKRLQKQLKKERKIFMKQGVIAVMCRCECKLHKSCFDQMVREGVGRCMKCQDDIISLSEEIACNFICPQAGNGFAGEQCSKCRQALWRFNR